MRGEWIEMVDGAIVLKKREKSLPMRGEWIEIKLILILYGDISVSPHAGRVD